LTFKEFNLDNTILEGLDSMGFETPTPIQEKAIPFIMENRDLIACAQTGTGKTAAYLLPILHNIVNKHSKQVDTIIIAPTRELAQQIDQQLEGFAYFVSVSSLPVYGGGDGATFERQKKALIEGTDIIVATPGKLLSHLNLGYVDVSRLQHLVLDEADRMLDMGFHDDIMKIISMLPKKQANPDVLGNHAFPHTRANKEDTEQPRGDKHSGFKTGRRSNAGGLPGI
jgi:ATP-dependent RNA helicase RhlE